MKRVLVFFLLLCAMAVGQIREYIYMTEKMTWSSAQRYCRKNYVDLATVTSDEENQRLVQATAALNISRIWVGMKRTEPGLNIWQWSDGEPARFFRWSAKQPDNGGGNEDCVMVSMTGWNDLYCKAALSFCCSWRFVLVKEKKTWQEALEYCRTHYTGLASPISPEQLSLAERATAQTETVSVWTGLHFLNGQWVCVSRAPTESLVSLPSCPAPRHRCGSLNTHTRVWENRDCSEKLHFLCH